MTAWQTVRLVATREIRERVRSRAFIASIAVVVLVVVVFVVIVALAAAGREGGHTVGTVGIGAGPVREALRSLGDEVGEDVRLRSFGDRARGERALREDEVDLLVVGGDHILVRGATDRADRVVEATSQVLRIAAAAQAADDRADAVLRRGLRDGAPSIRSLEPLDRERVGRIALGGASAFLLFLLVATTGGLILTGVVEEKNSRVVEVVASAAGAGPLLAGKILGVAVLGLGLLAVLASPALFGAVQAAAAGFLPPGWVAVVGLVVLWFLLGYAFYAYVLAAMGSLVSRMEDLQYSAMPVMLVLFLSFYAIIPALSTPDGPTAVALSFFPPTAPAVMLVRVAAGAAPWWEVVAAVAVMVAAIVLVAGLGARVYSAGILHTGRRLKLREALRIAEA